ncbi:uncharacterized protein LTR77_008744 [Saxophila tyrrhenica]|uniref:Maintenance of telomere capping protein 1 n=1 Tax=Saxophila tyrrhenica TaxID=1690608 RepID=A0AAV9P3U0_9PEZI|nr:hypothetical protein LTR77_008744 [Saxophila tyrrhenica]
MARKADDLLADLDQLGLSEDQPSTTRTSTSDRPPKPAPKPSNAPAKEENDDPFGELEKTLAAKPASGSRPTTPRLSSSTTSGTGKSPRRAGVETPASSGTASGRNSEDRLRSMPTQAQPRTSGEGRSYHQSYTPAADQQQQQQQQAPPPQPTEQKSTGGGWSWGSLLNTATATATSALTSASTLAKDLQNNEEALRWASSVKGYGANLSHLSEDLRSRAIPTFTSLISHIAPPISAHERLQIHITHDILNYPSLDPLIYSTFSRVMSQVEGGDLLVIQRGSESRSRSASQGAYTGSVLGGSRGGWSDGPWWRDDSRPRDLGAVMGLKEGTRLARVGAESYAKEFFEARGGVEKAAREATESLGGENPVRRSDIFLAVQPIAYEGEKEMFAGDAREEGKGEGEGEEEGEEELVVFAIYLHDPLHSLSFSIISQPFPRRWASWLDAKSDTDEAHGGLPADILAILENGGVDPREWVAEWMEEVLGLGVGVVAQRYVARRMGVGEGGSGEKGRGLVKAKERGEGVIEEAAGRGV